MRWRTRQAHTQSSQRLSQGEEKPAPQMRSRPDVSDACCGRNPRRALTGSTGSLHPAERDKGSGLLGV